MDRYFLTRFDDMEYEVSQEKWVSAERNAGICRSRTYSSDRGQPVTYHWSSPAPGLYWKAGRTEYIREVGNDNGNDNGNG